MLARIIDFALANRFLVLLASLLLLGAGAYSAARLPVDAVPDDRRHERPGAGDDHRAGARPA